MFKDRLILAYHLLKQKNRAEDKSWPDYQWILGHRGARAESPENTLPAFKLSMDLHADGIEFDVSLSKDFMPVVIHDHTVDRTTFGQGKVKDLSWDELSKLDASKPISDHAPTGVPNLKQTLELLPDEAIANIELKFSGNFSKAAFIDSVLKIIKDQGNRLKIIVSSFDGELLSILRKKEPKILISLILSPKDKHWPTALGYLPSIMPQGLHLSGSLISPFILWLIKRAGLKVGIWTINDIKTAQKLLAMGVDGIFTDQVRLIRAALPLRKVR